MPELFRKRAILAKIETQEGTDSSPTGAANAILCGNITVTPISGGIAERQLAFPFLGDMPALHVNRHVMVAFSVELQGSGTAGTAPAYGPLLRACGMSETVTPSTKVEYSPISANFPSVTIYAYESGILHKLTGARGNVAFVFERDSIPHMRFSFLGRWNNPTAEALPSVTLSGFIDPLAVNYVNTPTFTLDSFGAVLEAFTLDAGVQVVARDRPNAAYVAITDRRARGNLTIECPALGTKDFFALAAADAAFAGQLVHGTVAGKIVQIDFPAGQILQPTYGDADGVRTLSAAMRFNRMSGDDEFKLTVK